MAGRVVAIANVAQAPPTLVDVDAPSEFAPYASVLLGALLKAEPGLAASESLDDRWRLSCCLWREAGLDAGDPRRRGST